MRPHFIAGLALALAACCHPPDGGDGGSAGSGTSTTTTTTCTCDCPDGPPPPPALDTFCAFDEHAGMACCRPGGGICTDQECVALPVSP